ncbi:MAG: heme o synthase [Candidatus Nitrosocosmicus sp.]|jgi:protoheme IX farnesyltransferase|uniref:heme o synthase n=1 Tax=Candidatus Nitrosocosmicus sp. FF01 TaxID=3397670 RepID=UPI002A7389C8|nr:protoheme IX farnesyltransferase [Candidatus Nitrosocosmicus sp.]GKS61339.1 protoheme IX farnesyltransferase [Candidatus Nitrosocosmicus sp.]HKR74777.1 heme o synthase [Candidatus Nitrosocosmicus sp.]
MKTVGNQVKNYYELTKPKIWYLLVFTALGAAVSAAWLFDVQVSLMTWILLFVAIAAGSAAADTLTGYNDRDIDAIMERTKGRPIPSGRISPRNALIFGLVLAGISLVCSWFINIWAFGLMAFGLFDNIIVYSKWLKRTSQSNIILGGFSGGAPALIGYIAVTFQHVEIGFAMAGLVFFWIPTHIWSLALHVKEDYKKANVPMLPVVSSESKSVRIIALTTLMMVVFSILPFFFNQFGLIYLLTATVFGIVMIFLSIWLLLKPSEKTSWLVFKFSSPYLAALFIAFMVDAFFH